MRTSTQEKGFHSVDLLLGGENRGIARQLRHNGWRIAQGNGNRPQRLRWLGLAGEEILVELPLVAEKAVARLTYWQILEKCLHTAFLGG